MRSHPTIVKFLSKCGHVFWKKSSDCRQAVKKLSTSLFQLSATAISSKKLELAPSSARVTSSKSHKSAESELVIEWKAGQWSDKGAIKIYIIYIMIYWWLLVSICYKNIASLSFDCKRFSMTTNYFYLNCLYLPTLFRRDIHMDVCVRGGLRVSKIKKNQEGEPEHTLRMAPAW